MSEELQEQSEVVEVQTESAPVENENTTQENEAIEATEQQVPQSRVNKITWEKHQAIRDRDNLQKQLDDLKSVSTTQNQVAPVVNDLTLESFDYDQEKFDTARITREVAHRFKTMQEDQRKLDDQKTAKSQLDTFNQKASVYAETHPEYNDAINASGNIQFSESISQSVLSSDKPAELHHWLLNNPQEVNKLDYMQPLQVAMQLGKIEASLGKQKEVKQSNAPEPIETVQGTSTTSSDNYSHIKGAVFT